MTQPKPVPAFDHIFIVIMENHGYDEIIGSPEHDPFIYYDNLRTDPAQVANVVPYRQLAADLAAAETTPAFGWITPNMLDDLHDGTVAAGDTWLSGRIPALLAAPAWTQWL